MKSVFLTFEIGTYKSVNEAKYELNNDTFHVFTEGHLLLFTFNTNGENQASSFASGGFLRVGTSIASIPAILGGDGRVVVVVTVARQEIEKMVSIRK